MFARARLCLCVYAFLGIYLRKHKRPHAWRTNSLSEVYTGFVCASVSDKYLRANKTQNIFVCVYRIYIYILSPTSEAHQTYQGTRIFVCTCVLSDY